MSRYVIIEPETTDAGEMSSVKKKPKPHKAADDLKRIVLGATTNDSRRKRAEDLKAQRESSRAAILKRDLEESSSTSVPTDETNRMPDVEVQHAVNSTEKGDISDTNESKDDPPFEDVLHRNARKRLKQQQERMDDLRKRAVNITKGLFKVIISTVDGEDCERKPFPEGSFLAVIEDLRKKIPNCSTSSSNGFLHVWVNSVEAINQLKQIQELASMKVVAECKTADQFWGRITGVDKGFTESEILATLRNMGVTTVRRETRKIHNGTESKTFPTDRVFLQFSGLPPQKVMLARREYLVILVAGKPLICYNCQRIGHTSSHCKRPKACMKCGGTNHLAAQCKRMAKCVNCFQNHPSWFAACPAKLLAIEQRNVLLEARVQAQVRHAHHDATIGEKVRCHKVQTNPANSQLLSDVSYADAVAGRTIVIQQPNDENKEINLPRSVLPSIKKAKKKIPKRVIAAKKFLPNYKRGLSRMNYSASKTTTANVTSAPSNKTASGVQKQQKVSKDPAETTQSFDELFSAMRCLVPIVKLFDKDIADSIQKLIKGLPVLIQALSSLGHRAVSKNFPL